MKDKMENYFTANFESGCRVIFEWFAEGSSEIAVRTS